GRERLHEQRPVEAAPPAERGAGRHRPHPPPAEVNLGEEQGPDPTRATGAARGSTAAPSPSSPTTETTDSPTAKPPGRIRAVSRTRQARPDRVSDRARWVSREARRRRGRGSAA